jgi:hypothetical protein
VTMPPGGETPADHTHGTDGTDGTDGAGHTGDPADAQYPRDRAADD